MIPFRRTLRRTLLPRPRSVMFKGWLTGVWIMMAQLLALPLTAAERWQSDAYLIDSFFEVVMKREYGEEQNVRFARWQQPIRLKLINEFGDKPLQTEVVKIQSQHLAGIIGRPITLVNGARCQSELYHHDEFVQLAQQHANFSYVAALSDEPEDSGWTGARGFVHEAAKAHFANDFRGHKAYLCGPPLMIDACITTLMQGRLFERDIYTEKFISAADAQQVRSPLFKKI